MMLEVETSLGTLVARSSANPNYPGISIYLRRGKEGHMALLGAVECSEQDATLIGVLWLTPDDYCYSDYAILSKEQTDQLYEAEA